MSAVALASELRTVAYWPDGYFCELACVPATARRMGRSPEVKSLTVHVPYTHPNADFVIQRFVNSALAGEYQ